MPLPAMSGALPWIGSYSACRLPDASRRRRAWPTAACPGCRSASTPGRTAGRRTGWRSRSRRTAADCAPAAWRSCRRTCASARHRRYSRSCSAVTVWRQNRPDCMTLAFSTLVTRFCRLRASSNATRATRSISLGGVGLGVEAALLAVGQRLDAARLAEIDAAGALAHDHQVEAAHHVGLQRRGIDQRVEHDRRAAGWRTGRAPCAAAGSPVPGAAGSRACPISGRRPSRTGSRRRPCAFCIVSSVIGVPRASIAAPPTRSSEMSNDDHAAAVHPVDDATHLAHHLGADAVAGQDQQLLVGGHRGSRSAPWWPAARAGVCALPRLVVVDLRARAAASDRCRRGRSAASACGTGRCRSGFPRRSGAPPPGARDRW